MRPLDGRIGLVRLEPRPDAMSCGLRPCGIFGQVAPHAEIRKGPAEGWAGVRPVDFVSATTAELGARTEAATSKDNAMTVSAALYEEYKQLSLERGLFPKGPNEFHDDFALGYAVYLLKMIPIPGKPNLGPPSEVGP